MKTKLLIALLAISVLWNTGAVTYASELFQSFTPIQNLRVSNESQFIGPATFSGAATLNGATTIADLELTGALDLDGEELTLDADADTSITVDTDDQIDLEIGGADVVVMTDFGASTVTTDTTTHMVEIVDTTNVMTAGTNTLSALNIDLGIGNSTAGTNSVYGLLVDAISQDAQNTEVGISVGSGWDEGLEVATAVDFNNNLDVDGTSNFDEVDIDGVTNLVVGTEHIGIPTIFSTAITYTAAAGGSGTVATITDGEIWLVHSVFVNVTTNFDATGDDATLTIGDGNDADGFIVAADANLQTTFTEDTGYTAGWYGIENGSNGAYTVDDGGPFVYAPSGADETIDWLIDETSGETITAGAATIYVMYTRIQ